MNRGHGRIKPPTVTFVIEKSRRHLLLAIARLSSCEPGAVHSAAGMTTRRSRRSERSKRWQSLSSTEAGWAMATAAAQAGLLVREDADVPMRARAGTFQSLTADEADANVPGDDDESRPDIPTEDFGEFMETLMAGMRADGTELARSAREAVANTFQVS